MRARVLQTNIVVGLLLFVTPALFGQFFGGTSRPNRWQLGVEVQNSTTGVRLTRVLQGSPAANQGLAVGDTILAVGGHQVGYVENRLVDLSDEINEHINNAGQVTLLILNNRGELRTGTLSVAQSGGLIRGTVFFDGSTRISPQAVMNVRMIDVSYNHYSSPVAQTSVLRPDRSPYFFELNYNPAQVFADHRYAIEAEVVDSGLVIYRTLKPAAFDPASGRVAFTLTAVSGSSMQPGWGQPATPYDQVTQWYQGYLGRPPTQQELYTWNNHIARGQPASDIQAYILGSSEYYDRYQNDPNQYLYGLYRSLYNANPSQQQMATWRQEYDQFNGMRSRFVRQVIGQR